MYKPTNILITVEENKHKTLILSYWLELVLSVEKWYENEHFQSVVDYVFRTALIIADSCVREIR